MKWGEGRTWELEVGDLQSDPIKGLSEGLLSVSLMFRLSARGAGGQGATLWYCHQQGSATHPSPNFSTRWTASGYTEAVCGAAMGAGPGVVGKTKGPL